jgi:hypothetical protein
MSDEKKDFVIDFDGKDYIYNSLSETQKTYINHILDLEQKIQTTQFNLQQLQISKQAFVSLFKEAVE